MRFLGISYLLFCVTAACDLTGGGDFEFAALDDERSLSAVTYNIWMDPISGRATATARAPEIAKQLAAADTDIIVLNEAFIAAAAPVIAHLANPDNANPPYVATPLVGTGGAFQNGGVTILSRHPMGEPKELIYTGTPFPFSISTNMGVQYVPVTKNNGMTYHIVATHVPGGNNGPRDTNQTMRANLRKQMLDFIVQQNIPASEPVLMIGDFNVEHHSAECAAFLTELNATLPEIRGLDGACAAQAREVKDGDALTWDASNNNLITDGLRQWLDYGLLSAAHLQPAKAFMEVRTDWKAVLVEGQPASDLSDHYPVFMNFDFNGAAPAPTPTKPEIPPGTPGGPTGTGGTTGPAPTPAGDPSRPNPRIPEQGGCQSGGQGDGLALLLLGLAAVVMRRREFTP